jgi:hypothetical protein
MSSFIGGRHESTTKAHRALETELKNLHYKTSWVSTALQLTVRVLFPETGNRRFLLGPPRCPQAGSRSPFWAGTAACSSAGQAGCPPNGPHVHPCTFGTGSPTTLSI